MARAAEQDVVIMAAAVADYTPATPAPQKIAKSEGPLTLVAVAHAGHPRRRRRAAVAGAADGPVLVGFAAETHDVIAHARGKLSRKKADLIVANDVSRTDAGFDVDTNAVTIVSADQAEDVPLQSKAAVAAAHPRSRRAAAGPAEPAAGSPVAPCRRNSPST